MEPRYISRIHTLLICLLLFFSSPFLANGQSIADSLRIGTVAQLVEDTIINTELYQVVISKEALEYYSQKERNEKAPGRSTVAQTIPTGSATLSGTALSSLPFPGETLFRIFLHRYRSIQASGWGTIPIESNVSPGGAITYSVPVFCTPGTKRSAADNLGCL